PCYDVIGVVEVVFCLVVYCFFFQAEDGIRDLIVTGVQTCALPILIDADLGWLGAAMNYYEVLCVPHNSDDGTIRSAFRRLARCYHPDVGTGSSPEKFRELAEAYETLIDRASQGQVRPIKVS